MKGFLAGVGKFLGLQALLAGVIVGAWAVEEPPPGYRTGSRVKTRRLREAPSPRVVFVGGSSVSFGVDSAQAETSLGRAVVNMGSFAWLGLDFMLAEAEAGLRDGDVVVLAPELQVLETPTVRPAMMRLLRENPRAFRLPTWEDRKWFLDHGHAALGAEVRHLLRDLLSPDDASAGPADEFDARGDFAAYQEPQSRLPSSVPYVVPRPDSDRLRGRLASIRAFARRMDARGVRTVFAYPPLEAEAVARQKAELADLDQALGREPGLRRILTLEEAVLPRACFYDTNYHLNREGRRIRTALLVERLAPVLSER